MRLRPSCPRLGLEALRVGVHYVSFEGCSGFGWEAWYHRGCSHVGVKTLFAHVYVSMCVYMSVCIDMHIRMRIYVCIHIVCSTCIYRHMYTHIYIYTYINMNTYIYIYIKCVCIDMYLYTKKNTHRYFQSRPGSVVNSGAQVSGSPGRRRPSKVASPARRIARAGPVRESSVACTPN